MTHPLNVAQCHYGEGQDGMISQIIIVCRPTQWSIMHLPLKA